MLHLASVFQHGRGISMREAFSVPPMSAYVSGVIKFRGNLVTLFVSVVCQSCCWLFWSSVVEAPAVLMDFSSVLCSREHGRLI